MQNSFLTTIRSLKLIEGCKGTQVYAVNPSQSSSSSSSSSEKPNLKQTFSIRSKSIQQQTHHAHPPHSRSSSLIVDAILPYGLPSADAIDPPIDPFLRPIDPVSSFAACFRSLTNADPERDDLCDLYLEQRFLLHSLFETKLLRRCLRLARIHAPDVHRKVVLSAWLRFERREDELLQYRNYNHHSSSAMFLPLASCSATSPALECPKAALKPGYFAYLPFDPCPCRTQQDGGPSSVGLNSRSKELDEEEGDVWFCIGEEEVACSRHCIAALSQPLKTMLYGGFAESRRERINFTQNKISVKAMKAVEVYSQIGSLSDFTPETVLEVLGFANKFCCEKLKADCDAKLAGLIRCVDDALLLIDYGLFETAHLLVAACLQAFLRELPKSLDDPDIMRILCTPEGKVS